MNDINLFDDNFSENLTSAYSLLFQVSYWGFTYCIFDNYNNKYIAIKHIDFINKLSDDSLRKRINEIIISEDILCKPFKNTKVILNTSKSTLVPASLFDIENLNTIFLFNHVLLDSEEIMYDKINNDLYVIYSAPVYLKQIFVEWFNEIKFYHQSCSFIQNNLFLNKNNNQTKVYVDVNNNNFDILVIESSNLLFYNTFSFINEDDFIYFVMNVYDKLKLNPETVEIILSGNITKDSENYQKIYQFIKNISFNSQADNFNYKFNEIPAHLFINITNLVKCE